MKTGKSSLMFLPHVETALGTLIAKCLICKTKSKDSWVHSSEYGAFLLDVETQTGQAMLIQRSFSMLPMQLGLALQFEGVHAVQGGLAEKPQRGPSDFACSCNVEDRLDERTIEAILIRAPSGQSTRPCLYMHIHMSSGVHAVQRGPAG
eukprot:1146967-Pelagomonas_calceolata.AAC.3